MRPSVSEPSGPIDLLVIGAGMAGLTAAARAATDGAGVVVVEKAPTVGGSAVFAGFIWTAPSVHVMRQVNPQGDPRLANRVVEGYADGLDWVRSLGVHVGESVTVLGYGRGCLTDMANYLLACERSVREHGELLLGATVERLLMDDCAVLGAEIRTASGEARVVHARSTLLATGGFGGDPALRREHIHPLAESLTLRANIHSTGDGLRLGRAAGAAIGRPNAGFYGHLIPSKIAYNDPYEFSNLSFFHSEHSVLVNLSGRRFCDETVGDHLSTLEVLEQPEARALLIADQRVHDQWMLAPYVEGVEPLDRFKLAYRRGARAAVADDVEEFEALPEEWGYAGDVVRDTLSEFNTQCRDGEPSPRRRLDREPLIDPPYYVIEVIPAITATFTGLTIDENARVLRDDGTPIRGLLAAGADAGGVFHRAYAGGLAAALVFGLEAAATAVSPASLGSGVARTPSTDGAAPVHPAIGVPRSR